MAAVPPPPSDIDEVIQQRGRDAPLTDVIVGGHGHGLLVDAADRPRYWNVVAIMEGNAVTDLEVGARRSFRGGPRRRGIDDLVTKAALKLQQLGVISYRRGLITVLDRPKLETLSCECYSAVKKETDLLLHYLPQRQVIANTDSIPTAELPTPQVALGTSSAPGNVQSHPAFQATG